MLNNILKQYKDKIVIITGSSGQIGKYSVEFFLTLGCLVYGIDIKKSKFKYKNFIFKKIDISNFKDTEKFISSIYKKYGKIDILINNAAVSHKTNFINRNSDELIKASKINLLGPINIIKSIAKNHKKKNFCKIINISSIYGLRSPDLKIYKNKNNMNSEIYGGTKAGIIQITKYFAVMLAKQNININCISPGGLENKKLQDKEFIKKYNTKVPMGRMCNVHDLQMALLYFSNDQTNYTTGQNLVIDGGFLLC